MLLRRDAKIELLRGIPLFADCSKKELQEIARITEERTVESGDVLIREGESGHEVFVVVDGSFEVSRRDAGRVAEIGSGDVVGEMALFSNRPRNATVTAVTPAHLVRLLDTDFLALLDRTSHLWLKIARSLADRVPEDESLEAHDRVGPRLAIARERRRLTARVGFLGRVSIQGGFRRPTRARRSPAAWSFRTSSPPP